MNNYPLYLFFIFGILTCGLILWFYTSYQKLRRKGTDKLATISSELEREQHISDELRNVDTTIHQMEVTTDQKFLNIRTTLFNIHYTLWEVFH